MLLVAIFVRDLAGRQRYPWTHWTGISLGLWHGLLWHGWNLFQMLAGR